MAKTLYFRYPPMSLNDMKKRIDEAISLHPELDGTELVIGAEFVVTPGEEYPPCSVVLELAKTIPEDEHDMFGSLALMPLGVKVLQ